MNQLRLEKSTIILGLGVVFALALRSLYAFFMPLTYDEAYTFNVFVNQPFGVTIGKYNVPNNHIFQNLLANISHRIFDSGIISFRLPTFISGLALVAISFYFVHRQANLLVAGLCLFVLSSLQPLIHYSVEARGYSLQITLFLVGLIFAWQSTENKNKTNLWGLAIANALAFWTVPSHLFAAGLLFAWLLFYSKNSKSEFLWWLKASITTGALTAVLYLQPIIYVKTFGFTVEPKMTFTDMLQGLPSWLTSTSLYYVERMPVMMLVFFMAGTLGFVIWGHKKHPRLFSLFWIFFVTTPLIIIITGRMPPFPRLFVFLLPLLVFVASFGWHEIIQRATQPKLRSRALLALTVAVVVANTLFFVNYLKRSHLFKIREGIGLNFLEFYEHYRTQLRPGDYFIFPKAYAQGLQFYASQADINYRPYILHEDWPYKIIQLPKGQQLARPLFTSGRVIAAFSNENQKEIVEGLLKKHSTPPYKYKPLYSEESATPLPFFTVLPAPFE